MHCAGGRQDWQSVVIAVLSESELGFEPSRSHLNLADAMLG